MSIQSFPNATLVDIPAPSMVPQLSLELIVRDPEVIAHLLKYQDEQRDEAALSAQELGVLAIRQASGALDTAAIQREAQRMLQEVDKLVTGNANELTSSVKESLKQYFDPQTGNLVERLNRLTKNDGELATLLAAHLSGEACSLSQTLVKHVGAQSPLFQILSPNQKDGLLARLQECVQASLTEQQRQILNQFSLDDENSALSRFKNELNATNSDLKKEFSLDDEDSALSRLVSRVERAQRAISSEFSADNEASALNRLTGLLKETHSTVEKSLTLDNKESPLARMSAELKSILALHEERQTKFQTDMRAIIESSQARKAEAARGTYHGTDFEGKVGVVLQAEAAQLNDLHEAIGNQAGRSGKKVGDHLLTLGVESAAPGAKIVAECKEEQGYTFAKARAEIEAARNNRDAQIGIFVFSKETAPCGLRPFERHDRDIYVVWDANDPATDMLIKAAVSVARALVIRQRALADNTKADLTAIDASVISIEKNLDRLEKVKSWAGTIQSNGEKIVKEADKMLESIRDEVESLKQHVEHLKAEK